VAFSLAGIAAVREAAAAREAKSAAGSPGKRGSE